MQNYFLRPLFTESHYLPDDMEGEGILKKVTTVDIWRRGGSKISHFHGDAIFEWSLSSYYEILMLLKYTAYYNLKM